MQTMTGDIVGCWNEHSKNLKIWCLVTSLPSWGKQPYDWNFKQVIEILYLHLLLGAALYLL